MGTKAGSTKARGHGEGTVYRDHGSRYGCPPVGPDGDRPKHSCTARWVAVLPLAPVPGKGRGKKKFSGKTQKAAWDAMQQWRSSENSRLIGKAPTVEEWLTYFLNEVCTAKGLAHRTIEGYREEARKYLIPYLGRYRLDALMPEHIRGMYAAMRVKGVDGKPLNETSIRAAHAPLNRALNVAVAERKIAWNPAAALVDKPQASKEGREGLSLSDAKTVLATAGDNPRPFMALYLGLRQSECLGFKWTDIDWEARTLNISRKLTAPRSSEVRNWARANGFTVGDKGRIPNEIAEAFKAAHPSRPEILLEKPKSKASGATLPIPTVVFSRLRVMYEKQMANGWDPEGFIFGTAKGAKPMQPKADWNYWALLLKAAGVGHIPLHAARNTTADLLRDCGLSVQEQMVIMRHSNIAMTLHYQKENLEEKRRAMATLEAHIEGTPEPVTAAPVDVLSFVAALSPAQRAALGALLTAAPALESA